VAAVALAARLALGPAVVGYDGLFSLVWGRELARGGTPDLDAAVAPTPHPLGNAVGALAAAIGVDGESLLRTVSFVAFGALVVAVFVLGRALWSAAAGAVAAVIVATRPQLALPTLISAVDVPFLALVAWAAVLALRAAARGALVLLALAGLLVLLALSYFTGTDLLSLLGPDALQTQREVSRDPAQPIQSTAEEEQTMDFVGAVMADVQDTWSEILGPRYERTTLRVFRDQIDSACGFAESASGPFYCPGDRKVYIDLGFYEELDRRFGAPGDFAQAYVLAHEIGHHLQTLLGIESRVRAAQQTRPQQANALSVRMELQADCFAGVWGHAASRQGRFLQGGRIELEPGDMEEGLTAAAAIGDDRIQRMSTGRVFPEKFTHGTSEQRVQWFRRGLQSGNPDACDTFGS